MKAWNDGFGGAAQENTYTVAGNAGKRKQVVMKLKTRIICTIGPSSSKLETLKGMAEQGMNVIRINSGHVEPSQIREIVGKAREAASMAGVDIGTMIDLQGPRVRVGPIRGVGAELQAGKSICLAAGGETGCPACVPVSYHGLAGDLEPGAEIMIDDGLIRLQVENVEHPEIHCRVIEGGLLLEGKGMNFPGSRLGLPSVTDRDRLYLKEALDSGIDWVSQSFVSSGNDVEDLKSLIAGAGRSVPVMAKIERKEAVENIKSIIEAADGIMVARGDLGVEMAVEDVPLIQKRLISEATRHGLPVVTATQMLESMISNPKPTRAEASDVANAILDGTDAVMLSAETAIGRYPLKAVEIMARIAGRAEESLDHRRLLEERGRWERRKSADAIGFAACKVAADLDARAIITVTRSGYTARLISRYRPGNPIIAVSPNPEVINEMTLVWGVQGIVAPMTKDLKQTIKNAEELCLKYGLVKKDDLVVMTGGFLDEESGSTNVVHVHTVE